MRQPASPATVTAQAAGPTTLLDGYWVGIAAFLRRFSLILSESWYDGIYLTTWPPIAWLAPLVALLLGLAEGATHWTFTLGQNLAPGQVVIFSQLLPFMVLVALVSALSTNLGLLLTLGFAIGDFVIAGPQLFFVPVGAQDNPLLTFAYLRVPMLISYALLLLLAVTPTLMAKYLSAPVQRLAAEPAAVALLRGGAMVLLQAAFVYSWVQAAPLVVRIYWGWINSNPPISSAYYLQVEGNWLVYAAVLAAALRAWLSYVAYRQPAIKARVRRLASALATAETHQALLRKIPKTIRVVLTAGALTLLLSGFIGGLVEAAIILIFIALILLARSLWLPRAGLWNAWAQLISHIPVVVRLVVVFLAGNYASNAIISLWMEPPEWLVSVLQWYAQHTDSNSATFLPVLLSTCLGLLIAVILLPAVEEAGDAPSSGAPAPQPA